MAKPMTAFFAFTIAKSTGASSLHVFLCSNAFF